MRDEQPAPPPLSLLGELVADQRTGELVCARGASEVHVYMQSGRVAWGTDTEHPFAFGRRISVTCGVSRERLADLVAECRREKVALGQGLVLRGLATRAQVREALKHQAALAVRALAIPARWQSAFFERKGFASYDSELTFSLDELLADTQTARASTVALTHSMPAARSQSCPRRVRDSITGCEWAERWQDSSLLERCGRDGEPPLTPVALRSLLGRDAVDFLAVRNSSGALLGAMLDGNRASIWCGVRADAPFGAAYAVLGHLCGVNRGDQSRPRCASEGSPRVVQDNGTAFGITALALMDRTPDVLGVCHLVGNRAASLILREGCQSGRLPHRLAYVSKRAFAPEVLSGSSSHSSDNADARTTVLGDSDAWTFGTELSAVTAESVWLVTSRHTAQGFGWACLTAMVRELGAA